MEFTPVLKALSSFFEPSQLTIKNPLPLFVMIISPHPDDESITGSLALRLALENKAQVLNVAVTLGSNKKRQLARKKELTEACKILGFKNVILSDDWKLKEKELKSLIQKYRPTLIIAPHSKDYHPTHIKSSELLKSSLKSIKDMHFLVAWSEFWAPNKKPNILVEVPQEILQLQMQALEKHKGEILRNPYHLRLPAWMMDNVRRGPEIIGGTGTEGSNMAYGVLYRLQTYKAGKFTNSKVLPFLKSSDDLAYIFKLILDAASGSKTKVK